MDKFEYKVRADEIKELIAQGDYAQAAEIADTIDWRRVKSVMMLCTISDLYKINRRYEDAKNMLLLAYERRPGGRTICYSLCELCIKTEDFVEALNYYKEFAQVAPKDPGRYILQYKLYEAQDVSLEERIGVLEELKKRDYREKWAYELAYLYHRVGLATRCVEECDELILWFGEGKYVIKAMELKMLHEPLTAEQQLRYDHRFDSYGEEQQDGTAVDTAEEQAVPGATEENLWGETAGQGYGQEPYASQGYEQEPYAGQGYEQEPYAGQGYEQEPYAGQGYGQEPYASQGYEQEPYASQRYGQEPYAGQGYEQEPYAGQGYEQEPYAAQGYGQEPYAAQGYDAEQAYRDGGMAGQEPTPYAADGQQAAEPEELDIQVKTVDVGQYNTINLQAELAEGLREVLGERHTRDAAITRSIMEPMMNTDTESLDLPEIDEVDEEDLGPESEEMESSEVFFGETADLGAVRAGQPEEAAVFAEAPLQEERKSAGEPRQAGRPAEAPPQEERKSAGEPRQSGKPAEAPLQEERKSAGEPRRQEEEPAETPLRETRTASEGKSPVEELFQETGEFSEEPRRETQPEGEKQSGAADETAELVMRQMRREQAMTAQPPEPLARVLSQESDGQLSLVMPESESIEKQITGQMNIEDILAEWERMKKENAEKRKEEVRQHVLQHTGAMFTEFEAAVRDGLLEQLEQGTVSAESAAAETESEAVKPAAAEAKPKELDSEAPGNGEAAREEEPEEFASEAPGNGEAAREEEPEEFASEAPGYEEAAPEEVDETFETEELEDIIEEPEEEEPEETEKPRETTPVERERAKVRSLTREEKELYAPFIQSRASREELVRAIDAISMAAYTGNIVITGEEGMDTVTLAKNMIREVQMTDSNFSGKVAKISGEGLNHKNVAETLERLKSGALIIQKASAVSPETAAALHKALQQDRLGIIIVLEDTKKAMDKFLEANGRLAECFTARVDVEALSNDRLVAFGRQYAREMEYAIDELGTLALHTRIEELQTIDHVVTVVEVKEIVDEAIYHANRKTFRHFFDILFAKRYDEEDMIILTEKDFA